MNNPVLHLVKFAALILCLAFARDIQGQVRSNEDSFKVAALIEKASNAANIDSSIFYGSRGLELAREIAYARGEAECLFLLSDIAFKQGNMGQAIRYLTETLGIHEQLKDNTAIAEDHLRLQGAYWGGVKDYKNALKHAFIGEKIAEVNNLKGKTIFEGQRLAPLFLAEIAQIYILNGQPDSALYFIEKCIRFNEKFNGATWGFPIYLLATVQNMKGDYRASLGNYLTAKTLTVANNILWDTIQFNSGLSTLYLNMGRSDSAKHYALSVIKSWTPVSETKNLIEAMSNLGEVYKLSGEKDSAIKYIELTHYLKDSIFSAEQNRQVQNIIFQQQLQSQELASAQTIYKSRMQKTLLAGGLFTLFLVTMLLWRNNQNKQRAYATLEAQEKETQQQKSNTEIALEKLKSTQSQLVQSAKMASLGELTAGIAHEIQNPLNFVNNFSDLNQELLNDMIDEIKKGNPEEVESIANNLRENEAKINTHGKRAEAIVRAMLQHSKASNGQKEPTDINKLVEEYFRIAYHGFRSKSKSFSATLDVDVDPLAGKVNIIPQEMGSVLLNLYNNAFFAVQKKTDTDKAFQGIISITTKRAENSILITVSDNGTGIPEKLISKIFQPFFTTKPTGQGTGLGLSLSYDIITMGHQGELSVESTVDIGTTFTIQIPV